MSGCRVASFLREVLMTTMKRWLVLLAVASLTAAFTWLLAAYRFSRQETARVATELARAEAERVRLEQELRTAQPAEPAPPAVPPPTAPGLSARSQPGIRPPAPPAALPAAPRVPPLPSGTELFPGTASGTAVEAAVIPIPEPAPPQGWAHYQSLSGTESRCVVRGSSSSQNWELRGVGLAGSFDLDARVNLNLPAANIRSMLGSNIIARAEVQIPVRSLHSQATSRSVLMDKVVYETLSDRTNAQIVYRLAELTLRDTSGASRAPLKFDSLGELVIRGVTNWIDMAVTLDRTRADRLTLSGARALRMSDFGIQAPAPTVGRTLMQVADEVVISFDWVVRPVPVTASR